MEARFGGEAHHFYGMSTADLPKRVNLEWDLNHWKWDGDLFIASSVVNPVVGVGVGPSSHAMASSSSRQFFPLGSGAGGSSNSSSSCSEGGNLGMIEKGKRELVVEKRRRVNVVEEEDNLNDGDEAGTLTLKLGGGGRVYNQTSEREVGVNNWEGTSGKKTKLAAGGSSSRAVCQVEDCGADLSSAKDYHRRHKVCEMHSKASKALVGNVLQRFCQQCSR